MGPRVQESVAILLYKWRCESLHIMPAFPEEQLDSPACYFAARPGQTLKGWSMGRSPASLHGAPRSSTWLALDNNASNVSYGAIKIFTTMATEGSTGNNERSFFLGPLKNITRSIPKMESYFYEHDTKGKRHFCLVFHVLGPSVEDLRLTNVYHGEYLPLYTVQKIIGDISTKLADLAELKIVHGGGVTSY